MTERAVTRAIPPVAVIGGGTMGAGVAQVFLEAGARVVLGQGFYTWS